MTASLDNARQRFRPTLQAAGLLLVLLLAFFSTPLSSLGRTYYSSADLSQGAALTRSRAGNRPQNPLLSDPAVQMQPWLMFNRDALAAGELPLWNDWNATGAPHLANYQSAVFSPFSVPFYLLDFRWALLVAACAKLFCLGLFAYWFFRAIELGQLAAVTGAVAFAFSGLNVLLLAYPHSAVAITLPAGLLCVEKAMRAREARLGWRPAAAAGSSSRRGTRWVLALCLVLAGGLLCGHPEPFCFALLLIGAYLVARLASARARHRSDPRASPALLSLAAEIALAGVLAAGLAAVQIVPFLEYLAHSSTLDSREMVPLEIANWPLSIFPDALGNPAADRVMAYDLPYSNYEDVNTAYVGGLVVWLAALGAFLARSRQFLFFAACTAAGIVYGYDLFGLHHLVGPNLLMSAAPMRRSQVMGVFGLSACAALCVDRLVAERALAPTRTLVVAGLAAVAIALVAWFGAEHLFARSLAKGPTLSTELELEQFTARHYVWIAGSFAVGALALLVGLRAQSAARGRIGGAVFVASLFFQTGFLLRNYNPTIDDEAFFPVTPPLQELLRTVGDSRLIVLGESCLPPDSNLPYGLRIAANYDALWVLPFDKLYELLFDSVDNWRTAAHVSETGLKLCGVEYVLTNVPWRAADTETDGGDESGTGGNSWIDLPKGRVLSQTFIAEKDRLQGLELRLSRLAAAEPRSLRVVLEDLATGTKATASYLDLSVRAALSADPGTAVVEAGALFRFAPIENSLGRSYRLTVRAAKGPEEDALSVALLPERAVPLAAPGEAFAIDDEPVDGRLWFNRFYGTDAFEAVLHIPPYTLWRYTKSPTRFFCVDGAQVAPPDEQALQLILAPDFDPARVVLLSAPVPAALIETSDPGPAQPVTVVTDTHAYTRLRIERSRPGYVVISRAYYPGWSARVNGVERELLRANVGLSAVQVEAGTSEIELRYEPASFALGLWSSALCALAFAAWLACAARGSPARDEASPVRDAVTP